jgi:hypothetical protein
MAMLDTFFFLHALWEEHISQNSGELNLFHQAARFAGCEGARILVK